MVCLQIATARLFQEVTLFFVVVVVVVDKNIYTCMMHKPGKHFIRSVLYWEYWFCCFLTLTTVLQNRLC